MMKKIFFWWKKHLVTKNTFFYLKKNLWWKKNIFWWKKNSEKKNFLPTGRKQLRRGGRTGLANVHGHRDGKHEHEGRQLLSHADGLDILPGENGDGGQVRVGEIKNTVGKKSSMKWGTLWEILLNIIENFQINWYSPGRRWWGGEGWRKFNEVGCTLRNILPLRWWQNILPISSHWDGGEVRVGKKRSMKKYY